MLSVLGVIILTVVGIAICKLEGENLYHQGK